MKITVVLPDRPGLLIAPRKLRFLMICFHNYVLIVTVSIPTISVQSLQQISGIIQLMVMNTVKRVMMVDILTVEPSNLLQPVQSSPLVMRMVV